MGQFYNEKHLKYRTSPVRSGPLSGKETFDFLHIAILHWTSQPAFKPSKFQSSRIKFLRQFLGSMSERRSYQNVRSK